MATLNINLNANINLNSPAFVQINAKLDQLLQQGNQIMATQAEAAQVLADVQAELTATKALVEKIGTETDGLQAAIAALEEALANAGNVDPALEAAIADVVAASAAVKAAAVVVDEDVPDAP